MDVLTNKFELPKSQEEEEEELKIPKLGISIGDDKSTVYDWDKLEIKGLRKKPDPIVNRKPLKIDLDADIFEEEEEVKSAPRITFTPNKKERMRIAYEQRKQKEREEAKAKEEAKHVLDDENPTDLPPNVTPQLQFSKSLERPASLLNMPEHSGEINMMGKGQGIRNLEAQTWVKAWSYLSEDSPPASINSYTDFLFKTRLIQEEGLRTNLISTNRNPLPGGIFKKVGDNWVSIGHPYGIPLERNNQLLAVNASRSVKTGSPVDKYDAISNSWAAFGGDLPELDPYDTQGVIDGCLHNGRVYICTEGKILSSDGGSWTEHFDQLAQFSFFNGIASDGNDIFVTNLITTEDVVWESWAKLQRLSGSSLIDIKSEYGLDYFPGEIGYGSKSNGIYWTMYNGADSGSTDFYKGSSKLFSRPGYVGQRSPVASGLKYDYLAVGNALRRVDDGYTDIYNDGSDVGNLVGFDEQVCLGGQSTIFHTEWEGTPDINAVDSHGDGKFAL